MAKTWIYYFPPPGRMETQELCAKITDV